ncbi:helix-turn-helix domain-containing protein [Zoogloea ramigera]|uniref:helix-turn-helix domain-containing protein n=1 Tax=Zoogloea ramigera TaxID=350 RepID=UPI0011412CD2|nr:helix-turn-helix domain-containing protein [Zoogloea ramigera]
MSASRRDDTCGVGTGAYPRPTSVKGRVLAVLLTGAELTHLDCWERFGSSRLAHHAFVLRGAGWPIQTVERSVPTSDGRLAAIAYYALPAATIDQAGEAGTAYIAAVAAAGGQP